MRSDGSDVYSSMANPKLRAPRRCQKCHGAPLQSQCMHTKAGRIYQVRPNPCVLLELINEATQAALAEASAGQNGALLQHPTPPLDGTTSGSQDRNVNTSVAMTEPSTSTATLTTTSLHQLMLLHNALSMQQSLEIPDPMIASSPTCVSAMLNPLFFR
jgi:hypothetical protein